MVRKLYRSRRNRIIGGVCGGLAEFFHVPSVIIRIIAFILLLPGGLPGVIPYAVLWFILPLEPAASEPTTPKHDNVIDV